MMKSFVGSVAKANCDKRHTVFSQSAIPCGLLSIYFDSADVVVVVVSTEQLLIV